jgi:hypothetical protein
MSSGDIPAAAAEEARVNRDRAAGLVVPLLLVAAAASAVFYGSGRLHHDPSLILAATRRWLDGAVLYRDILEVNPPLIFYLTAPAVLISRVCGVPDSLVFVALVCGRDSGDPRVVLEPVGPP